MMRIPWRWIGLVVGLGVWAMVARASLPVGVMVGPIELAVIGWSIGAAGRDQLVRPALMAHGGSVATVSRRSVTTLPSSSVRVWWVVTSLGAATALWAWWRSPPAPLYSSLEHWLAVGALGWAAIIDLVAIAVTLRLVRRDLRADSPSALAAEWRRRQAVTDRWVALAAYAQAKAMAMLVGGGLPTASWFRWLPGVAVYFGIGVLIGTRVPRRHRKALA